MNTARPSPQMDSPKIYHCLSDARQMGPEGEMWVAVLMQAIFDGTRKVGISLEGASRGQKKWRIEEYKSRNVLKKEARKWLATDCEDILVMLGIEPSWFRRVIFTAHPELR